MSLHDSEVEHRDDVECLCEECREELAMSATARVGLELFHGRRHPHEKLEDWGSQGPVFLVDYVHVTYLWDIKLGIREPAGDGDLERVEDLIYYDGIYYGDWSVFPAALLEKDAELKARLTTYRAEKATPPKQTKEV